MPYHPRPSRRRQAAVRSAVSALALFLAGCGGGGGGGESAASGGTTAPTPPASTRETPLALTAINMQSVANLGIGYGESVLVFSQMAHDWVASLAALPASAGGTLTSNCDGGGTLTLRLLDRDASGRPSPGDQIAVTLANCYDRTFDDPLDGSLTIDLTTPASADVLEAATVTFGSRLALPGSPEIRFDGGLRYEYRADRLNTTLRALSGAAALGVTVSNGSATIREVITSFDARKDVHRDTARTNSTMQLRVASDAVGGSFVVSTTAPFAGWFNALPDTGELRLVGAGSSPVTLQAVAGSPSLRVALDGNTTSLPGSDAVTGYLWWAAGVTPQGSGNRGYSSSVAQAADFAMLASPNVTGVRPGSPSFTWQFSRPVATGQTATLALLVDGSTIAPDRMPADVTVEGATLTVTPRGLLVGGARYVLRLDPVSAAGSLRFVSIPDSSFTVADTIRAVASAASPGGLLGRTASLVLDGSGSSAPGSAITSTRWQQLSGPALTISNANSTMSSVSIASAATTSGMAVLQLEVQNAAGDLARSTVSLVVINDLLPLHAMRYRPAGGAAFWRLDANFDPYGLNSARSYTVNGGQFMDVFVGGNRLLVNGGPFAAGQTYAFGPGSGSGRSLVEQLIGNAGCSGDLAGNLVVRELVTAADGTYSRLAVDVTTACNGLPFASSGWRVNSTLPMPF